MVLLNQHDCKQLNRMLASLRVLRWVHYHSWMRDGIFREPSEVTSITSQAGASRVASRAPTAHRWPHTHHLTANHNIPAQTNVTELYPSTTNDAQALSSGPSPLEKSAGGGRPPLPAIDPRTCTATADCSPTPACGTPLSETGYPWRRTGWSAGAAAGTGSAAAAPTWATGSSPARQRSVPAAPPPDTASSRRPPRTSDRPTLDATRRLSL